MRPLPTRPSAGTIQYEFEALRCTVLTEDGQWQTKSVFGLAAIAYDGRGAWWLDALTCHDRRPDKPDFDVDHASALFNAVGRELDRQCREAIADRINAALADGGHMMLFAEHAPPENVRPLNPPPYVSARTRSVVHRGFSRIEDKAEPSSALFAYLLLIGTILCGYAILQPADIPQARAAIIAQIGGAR